MMSATADKATLSRSAFQQLDVTGFGDAESCLYALLRLDVVTPFQVQVHKCGRTFNGIKPLKFACAYVVKRLTTS